MDAPESRYSNVACLLGGLSHIMATVGVATIVLLGAARVEAETRPSLCSQEMFGPPFALHRLRSTLTAGADPNEMCPIDYGVGVSELRQSALHWLITSRTEAKQGGMHAGEYIAGLQLLVDLGADPNIKSDLGSGLTISVLSDAAAAGWPEAVELLLNEGADPNEGGSVSSPIVSWQGHSKHTWLVYWKVFGPDEHSAQIAMREVVHEIIGMLLAGGADPNGRDQTGRTALHASDFLEAKTVQLLLENGANPNSRADGFLGFTPLHFANTENAKILLEAGANPELQDELGNSPLHWHMASDLPKSDLRAYLSLFLSAGGNVDAKNADGQTPLHVTAWNGTPEGVALLLNAGADPNIADKNGKFAWELAKENPLLIGTKELQLLNADE